MPMGAKKILRAIDCDNLDLVRVVGHAYWYFEYDDPINKIYETESVYTPYLKMMTLEQWAEIGKEFVAKVEGKRR